MFNMFRGGKVDPITLMAVEYEEERQRRANEIKAVVRYIKNHYEPGDSIDADEVAEILDIDPLTMTEITQIEKQLRR